MVFDHLLNKTKVITKPNRTEPNILVRFGLFEIEISKIILKFIIMFIINKVKHDLTIIYNHIQKYYVH